MSDKLYDILNKVQRWLPALGVFYLALCQAWDLPYGDQVNKTIIAVATLLATTLEICSAKYYQEKLLNQAVAEELPVVVVEENVNEVQL